MNQSIKTRVFLMLAVVALAGMMILAGCSDDDDPVKVSDPPIGPESAGELVAQFLAAYEARDVEIYLALLDPEFLMVLRERTTLEFPNVGTTLDYTEEERIHQRMFSGDSVTDPNGDFVPGVQTIEFSEFMALAVWSPSDDPDRFPDSVWTSYEVVIMFYRGQEFSMLKVTGMVKIYARAHEVMVNGEEKTYYLMAGMVDWTGFGKGTEEISWGSVKALYR
jgi:hypothetical protein